MRKYISIKYLNKIGACKEAIDKFEKYYGNKKIDKIEIMRLLIKKNRLDWANWLIVRIMERKQYLKYAIYAAKQVLYIFEKKYPDNKQPKKAIQATQKVLKQDTKENRNIACDAAYAAYAAAAYAAAYASAACDAAYAAAASANAACDAANAACDAANAVTYSANAAYAANKKMKIKILKYGIRLLEKE